MSDIYDLAVSEAKREGVSFGYRYVTLRQHWHEAYGRFKLADECVEIRHAMERAADTRSTEAVAEIERLRADKARLSGALKNMTEHYVGLVDSGDAGDWDPEIEPQVKEARAALEATR